MAKCDNCPNNCCGNNFVGMANAFKHSNGDLFNQILLSDDELENIVQNFGDEYIEYYNEVRMHRTLNMKTPSQVETEFFERVVL